MFLSFLSVQNFSVIGDVELDFTEGLNVFTGETGAGKTLIVNAIKILLGDKLSKNFFRDEGKPIKVQGVFAGDFSILPQELLDEFDIGEEIIIRRESDLSGKNKVSINGVISTLKTLQSLTENFIDIHGQHEHQLLLNPRNHLLFIDSLVDADIKSRYGSTYRKWKKLEKDIVEIASNIENAKREKEFLEYQIQEINQLKVDPSEDAFLNEKIEMLSNIDKIRSSLTSSLNMINFDEINVYNLLLNISKELGAIAKFGEEFSNIAEKIDSLLYDIQDIGATCEAILAKYDLDESELNRLIDRKESINRVCKKYNKSIEEIPLFLEELEKKLELIELTDKRILELEKEKNLIFEDLKREKSILNGKRKEIAMALSDKITEILKDLELKNAIFTINCEEKEAFDERAGFDAEFYISTNIGFEPGPLSRISSGGEISRVMLALKEAFSQVDMVGTLLFDEIDTGISGVTAKKVGEKLKLISRNKQVIVITHLPVVAARGDTHFHLIKEDMEGKTKTVVRRLSGDERIKVIASMISGEITDLSLKQAEEILGKC